MVGIGINVLKQRVDGLIVGVGARERTKQRCNRDLALAVNLYRKHPLVAGLKLEPSSTAWNQLSRVQVPCGRAVELTVKIHTRGPDQLADDYSFGPVDDEGAMLGHHGKVTHEDLRLLNLAAVLIPQLRPAIQRCTERQVTLSAIVLVEFGIAKWIGVDPQPQL